MGLPSCVCFYIIGRSAMFPGLVEWYFVVGVLWGPVAYSPWSPESGILGVFIVWFLCEPLFFWHIDGRD